MGRGDVLVIGNSGVGKSTFYVFEKYILDSKLSSQLIENITAVVEKIAKNGNIKDVNKLFNSLLPLMFKAKV